MRSRIPRCVACILLAGVLAAQTSPRTVHGTVRDQLGYVVAGAHITLQGNRYEHVAASARDGSFRMEGAPQEELKLAVDATGFAHFVASLPAGQDQFDVVLELATVSQEIN